MQATLSGSSGRFFEDPSIPALGGSNTNLSNLHHHDCESSVLQSRPAIRQLCQHSRAEWDGLKGVIESFYMTKSCSLPELMSTLSKEPYNFKATTKMFKTQLKRWGFRKNMTKTRIGELIACDANIRDNPRVQKYLKRKRAAALNSFVSDNSTTEANPTIPSENIPGETDIAAALKARNLEDDYSPEMLITPPRVPSLLCPDTDEDACPYSKSGPKFRIEILQSDSTTAPEDFEQPFIADSLGNFEYDDLSNRRCEEDCDCRSLDPSRHAFAVRIQSSTIQVQILNDDLSSLLETILGQAAYVLSGFNLLKHYTALRLYYEDKIRSESGLPSSAINNLGLLLHGFIEDHDIWKRFGIEGLQKRGYITDERLLSLFYNARMSRGISDLDSGFKAADDAANYVPTTRSGDGPFMSPSVDMIYMDDPWSSSASEDSSSQLEYESAQKDSSCHGEKDCVCYVCRSLPFDSLSSEASSTSIADGIETEWAWTGQLPHIPVDNDTSSHTIDITSHMHRQQEANLQLLAEARCGNSDGVAQLLRGGADPNALLSVEWGHTTPVIAAIENGHESIVELLADHGADINLKGILKTPTHIICYAPLHAAIVNGTISAVQLLLDRCAEIHTFWTANGPDGLVEMTPLTLAKHIGKEELFSLLLGWNTSFSTSCKSIHFIDKGNNASNPAKKAREFLQAATDGKTDAVIELLRTGAHIDAISWDGTALSGAIEARKDHIVKLLLKHGASAPLASLYLARSGKQDLAQEIIRVAYSGRTGFQRLRERFVRQFKRMSHASQQAYTKLRECSEHFRSYRHAWSRGIEIMQGICRGEVPSDVKDTLAFLTVARAIAETLAGGEGNIIFVDSFDRDLGRWQQLFRENDDLLAYREATRSLWGVELFGEPLFDNEQPTGDQTLEEFRRLISILIDGAENPLGLGRISSAHNLIDRGLDATLGRWQQRKKLKDHSFVLSINRRPHTDVDLTSQPVGLDTTKKPGSSEPSQRISQGSAVATIFLHAKAPKAPDIQKNYNANNTGRLVECLLRGAIFAVIFLFLRGIQYMTVKERPGFVALFHVFSLTNRLGILRLLLGIAQPDVCHDQRSSTDDHNAQRTPGTVKTVPLTLNAGTFCPKHWYAFLTHGSCSWI